MDSRFTQQARKALQLANETSREMGYTFVGSEHIIAGILKEGTSRAATALADMGISS